MVDRKKVLKGLQCCVHSEDTGECPDECPYYDKCWVDEDLYVSLHKDALELLKEQEPVKPVVNRDEWVCGYCGTELERQKLIHPNAIFHEIFEYCPQCGKKVNWWEAESND